MHAIAYQDARCASTVQSRSFQQPLIHDVKQAPLAIQRIRVRVPPSPKDIRTAPIRPTSMASPSSSPSAEPHLYTPFPDTWHPDQATAMASLQSFASLHGFGIYTQDGKTNRKVYMCKRGGKGDRGKPKPDSKRGAHSKKTGCPFRVEARRCWVDGEDVRGLPAAEGLEEDQLGRTRWKLHMLDPQHNHGRDICEEKPPRKRKSMMGSLGHAPERQDGEEVGHIPSMFTAGPVPVAGMGQRASHLLNDAAPRTNGLAPRAPENGDLADSLKDYLRTHVQEDYEYEDDDEVVQIGEDRPRTKRGRPSKSFERPDIQQPSMIPVPERVTTLEQKIDKMSQNIEHLMAVAEQNNQMLASLLERQAAAGDGRDRSEYERDMQRVYL